MAFCSVRYFAGIEMQREPFLIFYGRGVLFRSH